MWQSLSSPYPPPRPDPERGLWVFLSQVPLFPDAEDYLDAAGKAGCWTQAGSDGSMAFPWKPWVGEQGRRKRRQTTWKRWKKYWRLGLGNELGVARRSSPRLWIYNCHVWGKANMEFKRWGLFRRQGNSGLWVIVKVRRQGWVSWFKLPQLNFWVQRIQKGEKAVPAFEKFLSSKGNKGVAKRHMRCMEPRGEALPSGAKSKGGGACEEEGWGHVKQALDSHDWQAGIHP